MSGDSRPRYGLHRPSKQFGYRKYMYDEWVRVYCFLVPIRHI